MKAISTSSVKYASLVAAAALVLLPALLIWFFSVNAAKNTANNASVTAAYPSGDTIRENLLRISLRFNLPPDQYSPPEINLVRDNGELIGNAIDKQRMWSADGKLLTLLLGPGRVKTGLIAHETLGRAFVKGDRITLLVDGKAVKTWSVVESSNKKLQPKFWKLELPPSATREPLVISFDEPIDAMDKEHIAVLDEHGEHIDGDAILENGEKRWRFTPDRHSWKLGSYQLVINPNLEDPCGNSVASPFESRRESADFKPTLIQMKFLK